jgi:hypothetical protein
MMERNRVKLARFVLEAIDPSTECALAEVSFESSDEALKAVLRRDSSSQTLHHDKRGTPQNDLTGAINLDADCELEAAVVDRLKAHFAIGFEPGPRELKLRRWSPLDDLPYQVHTGRERALMLKGTKPLACFYSECPPNAEVEEIPDWLFDPYVEAGRFINREHCMTADNPDSLLYKAGRGSRIVLYALPHEEWRINAMLLLLKTAAKSGWSEGFERRQGSLPGYEDWQNEIAE